MAYSRVFFRARDTHLFFGVYPSFRDARDAVPNERLADYDNPESAGLYRDRMQVDDHDYPALFWIQKSLNEGFRRMGDLGGNIGIKYYAFGDKISWPPDFRWTVIDLPAVVAEGVRFAGFRGQAVAQLDFSSETKDLEGVDLLLASGVLQYLPFTLGEMLDTLETKPRRILVNTTPLHETRDYFTLNNIGTALCPYRVQSRALFVQEIEARGYRLRDQWSNIGKRLTLSYEAGYSLDHYSGYCFDRT